ncbi:hypothetical protein BP6252_06790 [Coleophoma cylindrospora]|uniref:Heterokaryon incompatibility domain-containing protein n=1 Tax=Coleophoma cylindrospora TaxID=1849047 RepID=A0A3D8RFP9_9HELO|nr:hypothetical protein BP6252_06790 [Coleophoma cylindrospora]
MPTFSRQHFAPPHEVYDPSLSPGGERGKSWQATVWEELDTIPRPAGQFCSRCQNSFDSAISQALELVKTPQPIVTHSKRFPPDYLINRSKLHKFRLNYYLGWNLVEDIWNLLPLYKTVRQLEDGELEESEKLEDNVMGLYLRFSIWPKSLCISGITEAPFMSTDFRTSMLRLDVYHIENSATAIDENRYQESSFTRAFRISSKLGEMPNQYFFGRKVERDPLSNVASEAYTQFLSQCDNHHKCIKAESKLPTRVVDIGKSTGDLPRIVETQGLKARYVALSYCWGNGPQFTTTLHNLTDRKKAIDVSKVPQTFKDAIQVTRSLGVQYLWIDSLCIIQDDKSDWERESAQMASVYAQAYVTIAASNSAKSSDGFLALRPDVLEMPYTNLGSTTPINLRLLKREWHEDWLFHGNMDYALRSESEALLSRAWALQERYLSARILLYTRRMMYFSCRQVSASEEGDVYRSAAFQVYPPLLATLKSRLGPRALQKSYSWWRNVLREFSETSLTYQSDKLPALAGLATTFSKSTRSGYVAGLWWEDILNGLLWRSHSAIFSFNQHNDGPSFSWIKNHGHKIIWDSLPGEGYEAIARFEDYSTSATYQSPFGEDKKAAILVTAPLLPLQRVDIRDQPLRIDGLYSSFPHDSPDSRRYLDHSKYDSPYNNAGLQGIIPEVQMLPVVAEFDANSLEKEGVEYALILAQRRTWEGGPELLKFGHHLTYTSRAPGDKLRRPGRRYELFALVVKEVLRPDGTIKLSLFGLEDLRI